MTQNWSTKEAAASEAAMGVVQGCVWNFDLIVLQPTNTVKLDSRYPDLQSIRRDRLRSHSSLTNYGQPKD